MQVSLSDEVEDANFGDPRLSRRLVKIADEFGASHNLSIPGATTGRAEMEAACRRSRIPQTLGGEEIAAGRQQRGD